MNVIRLRVFILAVLCLAVGSSCSYIDSTIEPDSSAIIDMSFDSVACRKKTGAWPADASVLDAFARKEGLKFRAERFKEVRFVTTNDSLFIEYIVTGEMTKGKTRVSIDSAH